MIYLGTDIEKEAAMSVAKLMAAAAKTAPKGCGEDNVEVLTHREQEILHFYKCWDELRLTRRFLDSCILLYYDIFTISRI